MFPSALVVVALTFLLPFCPALDPEEEEEADFIRKYKLNFDVGWRGRGKHGRCPLRASLTQGKAVGADIGGELGQVGELDPSKPYGPNVTLNYPNRPDDAFFQDKSNMDEYYRWSSLSDRFHTRQCNVAYRRVEPGHDTYRLMTFKVLPYGNSDTDRVVVQLGLAVTDFTHIRAEYNYNHLADAVREAVGSDVNYDRFVIDFLSSGGFNCHLDRGLTSSQDSHFCNTADIDKDCCYTRLDYSADCSGLPNGNANGGAAAESLPVTQSVADCPREDTGCTVCLSREQDRNMKKGCIAQCLSGLILQVELYPKTNVDGRATVSAISFLQRLTQAPKINVDEADTSVYDHFGFNYKKEMVARYASREMPVNPAGVENKLKAGAALGFWIEWVDRNASAGDGPHLRVGNEGNVDPFIDYDLSRGLHENEADDGGWRNGWAGDEVLRPVLDKTFRPLFYSVQGVASGKKLRLWLPCPKGKLEKYQFKCEAEKLSDLPGSERKANVQELTFPPLVAAALGLAGFNVLVAACGFTFYLLGRRQRNFTQRSETSTADLAKLPVGNYDIKSSKKRHRKRGR